MLTKDKVRGVFAGIAIGDALGMPVEIWSREKIKEKYGFITNYIAPASNHKYLSGLSAGDTTDDTQLTLAITEALIESNGEIDVDNIAKWHVKSLAQGTSGWGRSTRDSILNLKKGIPWPKSSESENPKSGVGNGIVMKIAPLGVLSAKKCIKDLFQQIVDISSITHHSKMAAISGVMHAKVIECLLWDSSDRFNLVDFIAHICETKTRQVSDPTEYGQFSIDHLSDTEDDIYSQMELIYNTYVKYHGSVALTTDWIVENLKGGCYVYESLPFSYAFFMRNPHSIDSLYEVVNAGGDTDSNGSIVGGMLGALHGMKIFPPHLVSGVFGMGEILKLADKFCAILDIR